MTGGGDWTQLDQNYLDAQVSSLGMAWNNWYDKRKDDVYIWYNKAAEKDRLDEVIEEHLLDRYINKTGRRRDFPPEGRGAAGRGRDQSGSKMVDLLGIKQEEAFQNIADDYLQQLKNKTLSDDVLLDFWMLTEEGKTWMEGNPPPKLTVRQLRDTNFTKEDIIMWREKNIRNTENYTIEELKKMLKSNLQKGGM